MTTTDSRPDPQPVDGTQAVPDGVDSGRDYNLARRVYGSDRTNGHAVGDGSQSGSGQARPLAEEPYNLARSVYGNGHAPTENGVDGSAVASPNGAPHEEPYDEPYNLARRVYGGGAPNGNGAVAVRERPAAAPPAPASAGGEPPRRKRRFSINTFDSVRQVPAFRWYMLASIGSFGSMNMQMLVRGFLTFELTGSFAALGTVMLANAIPGLALTVFGGVIADRYPKKYIVQIGQTLSALLAFSVGLLLLFGMLRFEHLLVSSFINGMIFALMMPARQSWIPDVVGMSRLMNAVALNSAMMTSTRMIGPLAGALLLAAMGPAYVYFAMMGMYAFSVTTLTRVPSQPIAERAAAGPAGAARGGRMGARRGPRGGRGGGGLRDLTAGFRYIAGNRVLRVLLLVNLVTMMLAMPYMMILPGWVLDVLQGDVKQLGTLQSIGAVGALSGALFVASMPGRRRGLIYLLGSLLMGIMLFGFSQSTAFLPAAIFMVALNVGSTIRMSISNVLVQAYVADEFRGRVMSVYMIQRSMMSLGGFGVGIAAELFGAQTAVMSLAMGLAAFSIAVMLFVPTMRNLD